MTAELDLANGRWPGSIIERHRTGTMSDSAERLRRVRSRQNTLVKDLRRAFARGECTADGFCAIESVRLLEEAIRSGMKFRAVFFRESAEQVVKRLLPQIGHHVETLLLPEDVFASAVSTESPQGVAALVQVKESSLSTMLQPGGSGPARGSMTSFQPMLVCVAGIQDPGNLGTILRSAEAFGANGVLLGEGTVSPFNPKAVRASAGSLFRLKVARVNLQEAIAAMGERGVRVVATSSHKGKALTEAVVAPPIALVVGNEGAGVPKELMAQVDETVFIPHSPQVESLNAAVAASIVLYEISRQKTRS
jgi:TrmH family RNA methyltransferase